MNNLDVSGQEMALAAWVRCDGFPAGEQRIISKANGIAEQSLYWMLSQVRAGGTNRLRFRLRTGNTTTTIIANAGNREAGRWHHAAAV